jgi:hypothetical protein
LNQKISLVEQKPKSRPMLVDNDTELPNLLKVNKKTYFAIDENISDL